MNFQELYRKIEAIDKGQSLKEFDLSRLNPFKKKEQPAPAPGQSGQPAAPADQPGGNLGGMAGNAVDAMKKRQQMLKDLEEEGASGIEFNGKEVDPRSIEIDGVDRRDYPDFTDAYVDYAEYTDGTPLSDRELEAFTDNYGEIVNQIAHDSLHESTVNECGEMSSGMMGSTMDEPKQQDSVTMNVSMNGNGAGGIRDLLDVLKDIQDGSSDGGEMPGDDMDMGMDSGEGPGELEKDIDSMGGVIDDDFGNSMQGDLGPEVMPMPDNGADLHREKGAYPKANGGDNAMKLKLKGNEQTYKIPSGPLKIKLEGLYREILSRDLAEGSGPKEKAHSKYVDRNSAESKSKVAAAKDKMSKDEKAKPGKDLLGKIKAK